MIVKTLLALTALICIFLIVAAMQANDYRVERKATLAATPAALFTHVNDQHNSVVWNPRLKLDPNVKIAYSGPTSGVGAACSWQGNGEVSAGTSTIRESKAHDLIRINTDWKEPMAGTNTIDFHFKPEGDKTVVTSTIYGPKSFIFKAMGLFMNCDKMFGDQLEKSLAELDAAASVAETN